MSFFEKPDSINAENDKRLKRQQEELKIKHEFYVNKKRWMKT